VSVRSIAHSIRPMVTDESIAERSIRRATSVEVVRDEMSAPSPRRPPRAPHRQPRLGLCVYE
jgi:hypothetical protein